MEEKREVEVQSLKKGNFAFIRSQPCRITEVTKKPKASVKGNERIYIVGKKIQITQVNLCQNSEALIFASTNPQYDDRLFIELQVHYIKIPSSNLGRTC